MGLSSASPSRANLASGKYCRTCGVAVKMRPLALTPPSVQSRESSLSSCIHTAGKRWLTLRSSSINSELDRTNANTLAAFTPETRIAILPTVLYLWAWRTHLVLREDTAHPSCVSSELNPPCIEALRLIILGGRALMAAKSMILPSATDGYSSATTGCPQHLYGPTAMISTSMDQPRRRPRRH